MIIYKITNKVNSKVYIGATTKDLNYRKQQHIYCASNTANCNKLYVAMREYGVDNFIFEKVCDVNTLDDLNVLECQYIKLYNSVGFFK